MTVPSLSEGVLRVIFDSQNGDGMAVSNPVVQVLSIRNISTQSGMPNSQERYRLVLSDGVNFTQGMLASQLNDRITNNVLCKNGIIRMTHYICNSVNMKRIVIILQMEVLTPGQQDVPKQGSPQILTKSSDSTSDILAKDSFKSENLSESFKNDNKSDTISEAMDSVSNVAISPIASVNPYQNKWMICARAYNKSELRSWSKSTGEGFVFSFTLTDESGEIKVTAFDDLAKKYFDTIKENKVYYLSKATVKLANKKFSNLNNQYEMILDASSELTECFNPKNYPHIKFRFTNIKDISSSDSDKILDVFGVVVNLGELMEFVSKSTNKPFKKRDYTLMDMSSNTITLTVFAPTCESLEVSLGDVIAAKSVKVGSFNGVSLSALRSSYIQVNPQLPEVMELYSWYRSSKISVKLPQSAPSGYAIKDIAQVKDENIGMTKVDFFKVRGYITSAKKTNIAYPACHNTSCNKKVTNIGGEWLCEKCNKRYPEPKYRYIFNITVSDHTGRIWLNLFDDTASVLISMPAQEMVEAELNDKEKFDTAINSIMYKLYEFNVRAKANLVQDEQRVNMTVSSFSLVDYKTLAAELYSQICEMEAALV